MRLILLEGLHRSWHVDEIELLVIRAADPDADADERLAAFGELVRRFQDMAFGYACAILRPSPAGFAGSCRRRAVG